MLPIIRSYSAKSRPICARTCALGTQLCITMPQQRTRLAGPHGFNRQNVGVPLASWQLEQAGGAHATTDAHGNHYITHTAPPSFEQRGADHPRAGHAKWVTNGN